MAGDDNSGEDKVFKLVINKKKHTFEMVPMA
jgi:hypothetical protein